MAAPFIRRKAIPENPFAVGKRFCRLLIIEDGWEHVGSTGRVSDRLKVRCDCGVEKFVKPSALKRGTTRSCGCLHKEQARELCLSRATHGDSGANRAPEYGVYHTMLSRCYNSRVKKYADYGGRGITVCERWRGEGGYENFLADMGRRPSGFSIERQDPDGPYSPENCKWADHIEQSNNRRSNRILVFRGERKTLTIWARLFGLKGSTVNDRLGRGWTVEKALTTPLQDRP